MPRSRGLDLPHQQSRRAPLCLKATAAGSEANRLHRIVVVDRCSAKLEDGRFPRSPLHERSKRGASVVDLETKLTKTEEELKKLRDQLGSAEVDKINIKQALEKSKKQVFTVTPAPEVCQEMLPLPQESEQPLEPIAEPKSKVDSVISPTATDVIEVVEEPTEPLKEQNEHEEEEKGEEDVETVIENDGENNIEWAVEEKVEEKSKPVELPESHEAVELKAMILEREKEVAILLEESMIFKRRAKEEAESITAAAEAREEELKAKIGSMESQLKESRASMAQLKQQLEVAEGAKTRREAEMKRLRVQTEQWRKAAEAAVTLLATADRPGMEVGGRGAAERWCGLTDKHLGGGYVGWSLPPMAGELEEDEVIGGRRNVAGIRKFGDLWKKKVQQK